MSADTHNTSHCIPRLSGLRKRLTRIIALSGMACFIIAAFAQPTSAQVLTNLHDFGASTDGSFPAGPLVLAADGSFVGTATYGGTNGTGCVYDVSPAGRETVLYDFTAQNSKTNENADGAFPLFGVSLGSDGNYYGCTAGGGASGDGTAFMLTPAGVFTNLHDFTNTDGAEPVGLVPSSVPGTYFGVCEFGGANNTGTIFKMTVPAAGAAGAVTTLYTFSAANASATNQDGANPAAAPIIGNDGNLYGTTIGGGNDLGTAAANGEAVGGTIWKIAPDGTGFIVLHAFTALDVNGLNPEGTRPQAGLIQISDGSFAGCCRDGGMNGTGTVFEVSAAGEFTLLYTFGAPSTASGVTPALNADGIGPSVALIQPTPGGSLDGTCSEGGAGGQGTVFRITLPSATTQAVLTTLYPFGAQATAVRDGSEPFATLTADLAGNLYGTTAAGGAFQTSNPPPIGMTGGVYHHPAPASHTGTALIDSGGTFFELATAAPVAGAGLTISRISPASGIAGGPAFSLAVTGMGFDETSIVDWAVTSDLTQTLATTYVSPTELTAAVPAFLIGVDDALNQGMIETHSLTVVNTDTRTATPTNSRSVFQVLPSKAQLPVISGLSPTSIQAGSTETDLEITGTGFSFGDSVTIGGTALTPTLVTATSIAAIVPASLLTQSQTLSVAVLSSAGASNLFSLTVSPVTSYLQGLQFISLPYDYPGVALADIFGYASPKAAVWSASLDAYAITPTPPANSIRLGRGYWIRLPTSTEILLAGAAALSGAPYPISLSNGWNMIGDPFPTIVPKTSLKVIDVRGRTYPFSDAVSAGIIAQNLYRYDAGSNRYVAESAGDMKPFVGYWIYALAPCTLEVIGS